MLRSSWLIGVRMANPSSNFLKVLVDHWGKNLGDINYRPVRRNGGMIYVFQNFNSMIEYGSLSVVDNKLIAQLTGGRYYEELNLSDPSARVGKFMHQFILRLNRIVKNVNKN